MERNWTMSNEHENAMQQLRDELAALLELPIKSLFPNTYKPGVYMRIEGIKPPDPEPIPWNVFNPMYPDNLKILADMAREHMDCLCILMSTELKAEADTRGESERIEEITGLKIVPYEGFPYGYICVGHIDEHEKKLFPASVCVAIKD